MSYLSEFFPQKRTFSLLLFFLPRYFVIRTNKRWCSHKYSFDFNFFSSYFHPKSASGCPIANRNKLRALEMESVVEKQRHLTSNGSNGSSLLVGSNSSSLNNNGNTNGNGNNVNSSNSHSHSHSHSHSSYMSSHLPLTSLVPPSSVSLSSHTNTSSASALKIDGVNCPTIGMLCF